MFKVTYKMSQAYLEEPALRDGSYLGVNKHNDLPVHLRWDDKKKEWVEVCVRRFNCINSYLDQWEEILPRQPCSCWIGE